MNSSNILEKLNHAIEKIKLTKAEVHYKIPTDAITYLGDGGRRKSLGILNTGRKEKFYGPKN